MSWQNQEIVYLIMYQSKVSGATLTELRKTDFGRDRLLNTLVFLGYSLDDVVVVEQKKAWKPTKVGRSKKSGGDE